MIRIPKTLPIFTPDSATPTFVAPAPINLAQPELIPPVMVGFAHSWEHVSEASHRFATHLGYLRIF